MSFPRRRPPLTNYHYQSRTNVVPATRGSSSSSTFETREQLEFRRTILRQFRCPFQENGACKHEASPEKCFFGHPNRNRHGPSLLDVPSYACIYYLANRCSNRNREEEMAIEQGQVQREAGRLDKVRGGQRSEIQITECSPQRHLAKCGIGIHLRPGDMATLEDFEVTHAPEICAFFGRDSGRICGICLEEVLSKRSHDRRFGILESCIHCYCKSCILEWQAKDPANAFSGGRAGFTCPICRVRSERVTIQRRFETRSEQKAKLFSLDERMVLQGRSRTSTGQSLTQQLGRLQL